MDCGKALQYSCMLICILACLGGMVTTFSFMLICMVACYLHNDRLICIVTTGPSSQGPFPDTKKGS